MPDDAVKFKDFSLSPEPIPFVVYPDTFWCHPEIPLDVMMELAEMSQAELAGAKKFTLLVDLIADVMQPESADVFRTRIKKGTPEAPNPNPIGLRHIREILPWVMEVYGLRPTQESSESADGSDADATSSTDGVSLTGSIS